MTKRLFIFLNCLLVNTLVFASEAKVSTDTSQALSSLSAEQSESEVDRNTTEIFISAELLNDTVYPETEVIYNLTVKSRADIHFSSVKPPRAKGVNVRRGKQDHQYNFVGNNEFRVSTYSFYVSAEEAGTFVLEGASLAHVEIQEDGSRKRVLNKSQPVSLNSRSIPDNYRGLWLPSVLVTLKQEWSSDIDTLQAGESITRTLTLFIHGRDIDSFPELSMTSPDTANVYNERPQFQGHDGGMSMTLQQVIVPRLEGELTIPAIAIPWFDLDINEVSVASVEPLTLTVTPNQIQTLALQSSIQEPSAGYWPFATILVTLLWGMTSYSLLKTRKALAVFLKPTKVVTEKESSLQQALEDNNPQAVLCAWRTADEHVKRSCNPLMDNYLAALYSANPTSGEKERDALIVQLKVTKKSKKQPADFASIEP
ncbi:hypothetical protein [Photobacterium minamisatsumaniensis]|uniref:hypothetical protein n=1 Tax=Photobacterium minamisatsumaniensis TaxID=2910233 RepID=UPI003D0B18B4